MRTVRLRLHVPRKSASDVYATLADFERYPQLCEAVKNVTVTDVSERLTVSQWEVAFRAGLLRWTEEDILDPGALTITFHQVEGDIAAFDGSWQCVDAAQGSEVLFSATLPPPPSRPTARTWSPRSAARACSSAWTSSRPRPPPSS